MNKSKLHSRHYFTPLRHSLGGKILFGFLLMAFISLSLAVAGIYSTNQAGSKLSDLAELDESVTSYVLQMELAVERQASSVRRYLLIVGQEAEAGKIELDEARTSYSMARTDLTDTFKAAGLDLSAFVWVDGIYADFSKIIERVLAVDRTEYFQAPVGVWEIQGQPLKSSLISSINEAFATYRNQIQTQIKAARDQSWSITFISLMLVIISAIVGGLVTVIFTRSITRPLRNLAGVAQSIRRGELMVHVPRVRGEDEVAFLSSAMASMAENLQHSRAELEESLNNTERRNRELTAVNRVTAAMSQSLNLDKILQDALEQLMLVAETEHASLFLLNEQGDCLTLATHSGQNLEYTRNFKHIRIGEYLTGQVAKNGSVLITQNTGQKELATLSSSQAENYKSFYIGVPLKSKGRVVGVISLTSPRVRNVLESEIELYNAIGSQIGIAIENGRLYRQAQKLAALEERNRLARDLHDSVTQTIFSITLTAESALTLMSRKPERVAQQLVRLQNLARGALAEMRALIFQLRPSALEEQGLIAALEKHIEVVRTKDGLNIVLEVENPSDEGLSNEHEQALYRIAQEALNNIVKHSKATHTWIKLALDDQKVVLVVRDNGVGFNPVERNVQKTLEARSLGMTSMRERAELAGGIVRVESQPGEGTTVIATLPLVTAPRPVGLGIN